jgi:hypothetical protein
MKKVLGAMILPAIVLSLSLLAVGKASSNSLDAELIGAVARGDTAAVQQLLQKGANIEAKDVDGHTALFYADKEGKAEIVRLLLEKCTTNIGAECNDDRTALAAVPKDRKTEIVQPLEPRGSKNPLAQYLVALQNNPNDTALREKIIQFVQTMKPTATIPEDAMRHYVMAKMLSGGAKKPEDLSNSTAEFKSALLVAPWWPEANCDFGLTLEAAGRFDEAIAYLKLCMATNPGDTRMHAAQAEIYKIEARKEFAAKAREESSSPAIAAPEQKKLDDWLKGINGRRYTQPANQRSTSVLDVRGNVLVYGAILSEGSYFEQGHYEIRGREFTYPVPNPLGCQACPVEDTFIISEDGVKITELRRYRDGVVREYIHLWQR